MDTHSVTNESSIIIRRLRGDVYGTYLGDPEQVSVLPTGGAVVKVACGPMVETSRIDLHKPSCKMCRRVGDYLAGRTRNPPPGTGRKSPRSLVSVLDLAEGLR